MPDTTTCSLTVAVMAGGLGLRLRPLTQTIPKVLAPIAGRPLVEHLMGSAVEAGISELAFLLGHQSALVSAYLTAAGLRDLGVNVREFVESTPRGTAGGLSALGASDHVIVINGDVYTDAKLREIADCHIARGNDLTIVIADYDMQSPFAVIDFDASDRLVGIREKRRFSFPVAVGIYVLAPRAQRLIPREGQFDMPDLIEAARAAGLSVGVYGIPATSSWHEIGEPDRYFTADFSRMDSTSGHEATGELGLNELVR